LLLLLLLLLLLRVSTAVLQEVQGRQGCNQGAVKASSISGQLSWATLYGVLSGSSHIIAAGAAGLEV
jgi:hypothetical protein